MNRRFIFASIATVLSVCSLIALAATEEYEFKDGKWIKPAPPAKGTPQGELSLIRLQVKDGENRSAVATADEFVKKYPDDAAREEVMYLAGVAEMNRGRYFQAYEWFKKQWDEFPAGGLSERTLGKEYEIADAFLNGKKRIAAGIFYLPARTDGQDILHHIAEQAPGSTIAERALIRVAEDHATHREYLESAQTYDHCLELFPKTVKALDVQLQAARMMHLSYRGVGFDPSPLLDAQHRFQNFAAQYPQTAAKVRVQATLTQIRSQLAQDTYASAQLYERTGKKDAAGFYYRQVAQQYADTQWGTQAKLAYTRLGLTAPIKPPPPIILAARSPESQPATEPVLEGGLVAALVQETQPPLRSVALPSAGQSATEPSVPEPAGVERAMSIVSTTMPADTPAAETKKNTEDMEPTDLEKLVPTQEDEAKE